MRIRQAVVAARDLAARTEDLSTVLSLEVGYRDPGVAVFGLQNVVFPVGDQFLEIVSPERHDAAAARYLDRAGGDAGYMVILQTDDLSAARERCRRLGVRDVWSADLDDIAATHYHPSDVGGAILSIDEPRPAESWRWGGPSWRDCVRTDAVGAIVALEIASAEPERTAARWAEIVDADVDRTGGGCRVGLDGGEVRFVAAGDEAWTGLVTIELAANDAAGVRERARLRGLDVDGDAVTACGVRFVLRS